MHSPKTLLPITTTTWLLKDAKFLQPKGGGHECTRPTPIQLVAQTTIVDALCS